ncbi:MAG: DUF4160 domain-containing protein [Arcicella sp.]|jgi:hypothetical protein|nr:DUF4160 domain-containing protein [Arcicella sp.]
MFESLHGIKIYLYDFDHNPPHFHAIFAEYEVLISINSLEVLKGAMPKPQLKKILKWAKYNQIQLLEEFEFLNPQLRK